MVSSAKTLIVVTGPTAVGKTQLCLDIARHFDIPIINADSRQIYRELRIGTARPTEEEMREVKHYFVGTLGLEDYYSASLFEQQVLELLEKLFKTSDYALHFELYYINYIFHMLNFDFLLYLGKMYFHLIYCLFLLEFLFLFYCNFLEMF